MNTQVFFLFYLNTLECCPKMFAVRPIETLQDDFLLHKKNVYNIATIACNITLENKDIFLKPFIQFSEESLIRCAH